jgi:RNA polymerase sigma-70 factor (ECF subfamily)
MSEARSAARRGPDGRYQPLDAQDTNLWDSRRIDGAEARLAAARRIGRIGRFQIEAAIQSVHCDRRLTGHTDWAALVALYEALLRIAPTVGGVVGLAAALGRAIGPQAGLNCLDAYAAQIGPDFQPFYATRARLLADAGRNEDACAAYQRAITLARSPQIADFLAAQVAALAGESTP